MNTEQERAELLPCPFCGESKNLIVQHCEGTIIHPSYRIYCDNCGASSGYTDRADHVENWNRRAALQLQPGVFNEKLDYLLRDLASVACISKQVVGAKEEAFKIMEKIKQLFALQSQDREDAERLDWLDSMNAKLNSHYGTTYRWKLILSPNVVRLMSGNGGNGHVAAIDLHDSEASGVPSCREAIDHARRIEGEAK